MNNWDSIYSGKDFFYGEKPNRFFADFLSTVTPPGKMLLPAEGEGRNAVFAATAGWQVHAFDSSAVARTKAHKLADKQKVSINYDLLELENFSVEAEKYDLIAIIYIHPPQNLRFDFHNKLAQSVKKGGHILIESFAREQINRSSGGPQNPELLYSTQMIAEDFAGFSTIKLQQESVHLDEGRHHGLAEVVRYIGRK